MPPRCDPPERMDGHMTAIDTHFVLKSVPAHEPYLDRRMCSCCRQTIRCSQKPRCPSYLDSLTRTSLCGVDIEVGVPATAAAAQAMQALPPRIPCATNRVPVEGWTPSVYIHHHAGKDRRSRAYTLTTCDLRFVVTIEKVLRVRGPRMLASSADDFCVVKRVSKASDRLSESNVLVPDQRQPCNNGTRSASKTVPLRVEDRRRQPSVHHPPRIYVPYLLGFGLAATTSTEQDGARYNTGPLN